MADPAGAVFTAGQIINYNNVDYVCLDAQQCNGDADAGIDRVEPSREACTADNPAWELLPVSNAASPTQETIEKLLGNDTCVTWDPSYTFMVYQWGCGATNMYRCLQPEFCSIISPDDAVATWNGPVDGS